MKSFKFILPFVFIAFFNASFAQTAVRTSTTYTKITSATLSQAFVGTSTNGNLIVVELDWGDVTHTVTSVTDTKGNKYKQIPAAFTKWNENTWSADLWYAYNITGGDGITVKATFSGTPSTYYQIYITEFNGILSTSDPLDQASSAAGTTANASSGNKTTGASNEMIYGALIGSNGPTTAGASFTIASTATENIIEFKIGGPVIASYDATFTVSNTPTNNWVAQMATFQTATSIVLPIELIRFDALFNTDKVVINWTTASETNNNYFTIERSEDASNFNQIAKITGAGTLSETRNYTFTDYTPISGINYYRLKQTDYNGKTTSSNIIAINCKSETPTITSIYIAQSGTINIKINANVPDNYTAGIYDMQGRCVSSKSFSADKGTTDYMLDAASLHYGIYFISIESSLNRVTQKLLIR